MRDALVSACGIVSQDTIPTFRVLKRRIVLLQLHKTAQLYLLTYQLVWEDRQHPKFWGRFGAPMLYVHSSF